MKGAAGDGHGAGPYRGGQHYNPVLLSILTDSPARSSIKHLRVHSRCLIGLCRRRRPRADTLPHGMLMLVLVLVPVPVLVLVRARGMAGAGAVLTWCSR